jgi:hypothetical protein
MGLVFSGIPQEITLKLAKLANVTTFVETGTYKGETTRWAAQHFQKVFTIEKSDFHFEESKSLGNSLVSGHCSGTPVWCFLN